jgi:hypothetical protein
MRSGFDYCTRSMPGGDDDWRWCCNSLKKTLFLQKCWSLIPCVLSCTRSSSLSIKLYSCLLAASSCISSIPQHLLYYPFSARLLNMLISPRPPWRVRHSVDFWMAPWLHSRCCHLASSVPLPNCMLAHEIIYFYFREHTGELCIIVLRRNRLHENTQTYISISSLDSLKGHR